MEVVRELPLEVAELAAVVSGRDLAVVASRALLVLLAAGLGGLRPNPSSGGGKNFFFCPLPSVLLLATMFGWTITSKVCVNTAGRPT